MSLEYSELQRMVKCYLFVMCALAGFGLMLYGGLVWHDAFPYPSMLFILTGMLVILFAVYEVLNAFFRQPSLFLTGVVR